MSFDIYAEEHDFDCPARINENAVCICLPEDYEEFDEEDYFPEGD